MQYIRNLGSLLLLAAVAAGTAGWGLGKVDLNHNECYVALAARGMTSQTQWLDDHLCEKPVPEATTLNRWMVPQCTGEPRLRKTPLAYWAVAGLVQAGLPLDEVTVRLPSMIASVLVVLVIFGVGRRMIGPRAAMMGTLMLAASMGLLKWGRDARPELLLMLWMTVAMACFWTGMQAATGRKRAAWLLAGWAAMGLANLSKEFVPLFLVWPLLAYLAWRASARHDNRPRLRLVVFLILALAGVVLVDVIRRFEALQWWRGEGMNVTVYSTLTYGCLIGLPLLGYFILSRPWGQLKLVGPTLLPGLVLMALLFVPWLWYLNSLFPSTGGVLWEQVGERGVGADVGTDLREPGFYVIALITFTLPWTIFLPGAVLAPLLSAPRRRIEADPQCPSPLSAQPQAATPQQQAATPQQQAEHADGLVYLLFWVFGLILLFGAAAGKRAHYILPALPALCLLAGYAAQDVFFRRRWFKQGMGNAIMFGHAAAGVLAAIATAGASQAASKGWVADLVGAIIDPLRGKVSVAQVAEVAGYLIIPVAVMALLLCAAAWAHLRNRPSLSFAGFVGAFIVLILSFGNRPSLLDESPKARAEVSWIRGNVPASAPIGTWGYNRNAEPLTFAIGHDMPNAVLARKAMIARHGSQEGMRLWEDWMRQDGGRWLLVRARDVDEVKQMGYTIVDPNHKPADEEMDIILFQPPGRKK